MVGLTDINKVFDNSDSTRTFIPIKPLEDECDCEEKCPTCGKKKRHLLRPLKPYEFIHPDTELAQGLK